MEIISRSEAKSQGIKKYFTGKPCPQGHVSERWVAGYGCIECRQSAESKEYMRNYNKAYGEKHGEKLRADALARHYENRDERVAAMASYRSANLIEHRRKEREYSRSKRDSKGEYHRDWRASNADKCRANSSNYRARQKKAEGSCSAEEFEKILNMQKFRCANCKCDLTESGHHRDHVMPLFLGGTNWASNMQALCPTCNVRKNARDPIEWAQDNGRLL